MCVNGENLVSIREMGARIQLRHRLRGVLVAAVHRIS